MLRFRPRAMHLALLVAALSLTSMGYLASHRVTEIATPNVDDLVRQLSAARTASVKSELRSQIHALGALGVARLRVILRDAHRPSQERYEASILLTGNPEALFDHLALIDDPDTLIRDLSREQARYCMSNLPIPRDPRSETEAALLRRWYSENRDRYGNLIFDRSGLSGGAPADYTSTSDSLFFALTQTGTVASASPLLTDLRARGIEGVDAVIRAAHSDSPQQRGLAYITLGMLGDSISIAFLAERLTHTKSSSEIKALQAALAIAESSRQRRVRM